MPDDPVADPEMVDVVARLLTPDEAEATWPVLERQWPHYRDYDKTAHRDIRIFRLERTPRQHGHAG